SRTASFICWGMMIIGPRIGRGCGRGRSASYGESSRHDARGELAVIPGLLEATPEIRHVEPLDLTPSVARMRARRESHAPRMLPMREDVPGPRRLGRGADQVPG